MPTQFIKATISNLKHGNIVIMVTNEGIPYGTLMLCNSNQEEIEKTGKISCITLDKTGLGISKYIKVDHLARVLDHRIARKLKSEELFDH